MKKARKVQEREPENRERKGRKIIRAHLVISRT